MSAPRENPVEFYAARVQRHLGAAERHAARSRRLSNLRGLSFAVFVVAGLFALAGSGGDASGMISLAGLAAFVGLVVRHAHVLSLEDHARRWARVNQDAHARVTGAWRDLPQTGERFRSPAHQYAEDLDLFGRASLFQRLCAAHTRFGQARLAELFVQPGTRPEVEARQQAVRALGPELDLCQELEALALGTVDPAPQRGAPPTPPDPGPLLSWAESEPALRKRPVLVWSARLLPPLTVTAITLAWFGLAPAVAATVPLLLHGVVLFASREQTARVFAAVSATQGAFLRYDAMLELLEGCAVDAQLLAALRGELLRGKQRPSAAMRVFRRAVGWFDLRHNGLVHPFVNLLLLWDVHCVLLLERWQERFGKAARGWFTALGELEALSSLAGLHRDEPGYCFAEVVEGEALFEAEALGHPLIDSAQRVTNDIGALRAGHGLLVTGSNMSGKSTFLRAMGIAAVLGLAGGAACAKRLRISPLSVRTSIRIFDSLESGVSHFYAELKKLKAALDATEHERSVLFLLDEILHGTNSRERRIGARWLIAELLERGALGAVSTHDAALCELQGPLAERVGLVHFRENVQDNRMTFDYKLRPGPVTAGNALRLMRIVGLDVPLEEA